MKKVIRITEGELARIVTKVLSEMPMGVPDNITETASQIYSNLISQFTSRYDLSTSNPNGYNVKINGNFRVSDYHFNSVNIKIEFVEFIDDHMENPPQLAGASVSNSMFVRGNKTNDETSENVKIFFKFAVGRYWNLGMIIDIMNSKKSRIISMLSHEFFHQFEHYKYPERPATRKGTYDAVQKLRIERVAPLNEFLHLLYFVHETEQYTRPSEFYAELKSNNITKEKFKEFFNESDIIKTLKQCRDYTFGGLVSELRDHMKEIDEFLSILNNQGAGVDLTQPDSVKINETLKFFHIILNNSTIETYMDVLRMGVNPFSGLFGIPDESDNQQQHLDNFVKYIRRHKNYREFFEYSIKRINFVGETTIKKLSKLYDMVDNDNNSIVNWDLHHKINRTAEKTRENLSELLKNGPYKINEKKKIN